MTKLSKCNPQIYEITFQGKLDESWQNWFANFDFSSKHDPQGNPLTILTGPVLDQAALRGIMNKIWDLNLCVISVYRG
jgi:hypothetical protein